jgi:hypothetical protein
MSKYRTHEEYVHAMRKQVVAAAQAMLNGRLSFLVGSRKLAALRHEAGISVDDADFMVLVGIDSETDELPLGAVRVHWDVAALTRLQPEIDEAERWAAKVGVDACTS